MTLGEPRAGGVAEIANMLAELTAAAQAARPPQDRPLPARQLELKMIPRTF